jgi:hypothetical protein
MARREWAHKVIDETPDGFYGEIVFTVRAGEFRQVTKTETFLAPDLMAKPAKSRNGPAKTVTMIAGEPATIRPTSSE